MNFFKKLFGGKVTPAIDLTTPMGVMNTITSINHFLMTYQHDFHELNELFRKIGVAFGASEYYRHFSELSMEEQQDWLRRVPVLGTNHNDWIPPFQWVPRSATAWIPNKEGAFPPIIEGNAQTQKPIPDPGQWWISKGFITMTTKDRKHIRFGFRPDDVDGYVTLSFTIKKF